MTRPCTAEDLLSWNPCDSESMKRMHLLDGGVTFTAADVYTWEIPNDHKLWVLLRPELIDEDKLDTIRTHLLGMLEPTYSMNDIANKCRCWTVLRHVVMFHDETNKDRTGLYDSIYAYVQGIINV